MEFKPPGLDLNSKTRLFMCYVCVCPCKCALVFLENIPDMRSVTDGVNIGSALISQDGEGKEISRSDSKLAKGREEAII